MTLKPVGELNLKPVGELNYHSLMYIATLNIFFHNYAHEAQSCVIGTTFLTIFRRLCLHAGAVCVFWRSNV